VVLLIASERRSGIGQETAGIVAAVLTIAVIAFLVRRSRQSAST
jgi:hypothetical protein